MLFQPHRRFLTITNPVKAWKAFPAPANSLIPLPFLLVNGDRFSEYLILLIATIRRRFLQFQRNIVDNAL